MLAWRCCGALTDRPLMSIYCGPNLRATVTSLKCHLRRRWLNWQISHQVTHGIRHGTALMVSLPKSAGGSEGLLVPGGGVDQERLMNVHRLLRGTNRGDELETKYL